MHEASLMRDLMARLLEVAAARGARRVVTVTVRLGALSHMSPAHFREHFEHAAHGTIAEGAELEAIADTDIRAPRAADVMLETFEIE
jgi:hydrogenase nickel incorporation protein HypA/HybF